MPSPKRQSYLLSILAGLMLIVLSFSAATSAQAQTLTVGPTLTEVSTSVRNTLFSTGSLTFTYDSGTGLFEARDVLSRNTVFKADVDNVETTTATDTTAAQKLSRLQATHLRAVQGTVTTLIPKSGAMVSYRSGSGKRVEIQHEKARNASALWTGHIDSLKFADADTTSALRLAALRKVAGTPSIALDGSASASIAAGAAAGTSPTVAVAGNGLAGRITITTGGSTTTTGVIATVTLPQAFPSGCYVTLTPADADAAGHIARVFVTTAAGSFALNASGTALGATTEYVWNYQVTGL